MLMAHAGPLADRTLQLRPTAHRVMNKDRLVLAHRGRQVRIHPYGDLERELLHALADSMPADGFNEWLRSRFDEAGVERARSVTGELLEADIVRALPARPAVPERFERTLVYLSQFADDPGGEDELLEALRQSTVVIVGVGGLGSWLAAGLAGLGVGSFRMVDFDVVEASNLNRTLLLQEDDVGKSKLDAFEARMGAISAHTDVRTFQADVAAGGLTAGMIDGADVVLSTADKPAWIIRHQVADACVPRGIPFLCPAGFRVGPFYMGPGSACAICDYSELVANRPGIEAVLEGQAGVPPAQPGSAPHIAASVAGVVLQDTLRLLTGIEEPATRDRVWTADMDLSSSYAPRPAYPGCRGCGGEQADERAGAAQAPSR